MYAHINMNIIFTLKYMYFFTRNSKNQFVSLKSNKDYKTIHMLNYLSPQAKIIEVYKAKK